MKPKPIDSVVAQNSAFAFELYQQLKAKAENLFFSPYSILTVLAMTYVGARANTAQQMAQVLHFDLEQQPFHQAFGQLQQHLAQNSSGVLLNSANALWIEQTLGLLEDFVEVNQDNYQGELYPVDFRNETEAVRLKINAWVEEKTQGKIQDILTAGDLTLLTQLVLVNALYFKGNWVYPFEPELTQQMSFGVTLEKHVEVLMMQVEEYFNYAENDNMQIIELSYGKSCGDDEWNYEPVLAVEDFSMLIFLPKKRDGLFELESTLNAARYEQLLNQMTQAKVKVFLPKFKLTNRFELSRVLTQMGMPDAFCEQADFSGINGTQALFISKIIHKTFIEVNEEGTEAAAATIVDIMLGLGPELEEEPPYVFKADHPFLFLIRHKPSKTILFLGRLIHPEPE